MERIIKALHTTDILNYFLTAFSLEKDYKLLGDFENFVYEVYKEEKPFILRITHSSHRDLENLYAEIEWINYLITQGINASAAFQSINGKFVEFTAASDQSLFFGSLFAKAKGDQVDMKENLHNNDLFFAWGKQIGQMHRATKAYAPSPLIKKRPYWDEDELLMVERYFPEEEICAKQNARELLEIIKGLMSNRDNFGLIHTDIHSGNFYYDGNSIHVYDFDDSSYHFFVSDIAIPLYYSCLTCFSANEMDKRDEFGKRFFEAFLAGYQTEYELPPDWEKQLPLFLMLRDITLYSVLHKKVAPEDRGERIMKMIDEIKYRIEQKECIVNLRNVLLHNK